MRLRPGIGDQSLLALVHRDEPDNVDAQIPPPPPGGTTTEGQRQHLAALANEDARSLAITDGTLVDDFEPYELHVYRIE